MCMTGSSILSQGNSELCTMQCRIFVLMQLCQAFAAAYVLETQHRIAESILKKKLKRKKLEKLDREKSKLAHFPRPHLEV